MLVLTNATVARSLSVGPIPVVGGVILRVVHFDAAAGTKNAAARERVVQNACSGRDMATMQEIYMEEAGNAAALAPFAFESGAMGAIRSRSGFPAEFVRRSWPSSLRVGSKIARDASLVARAVARNVYTNPFETGLSKCYS